MLRRIGFLAMAVLAGCLTLNWSARTQTTPQTTPADNATATPDNAVMITVFLKHDQSRPVSELNAQLEKQIQQMQMQLQQMQGLQDQVRSLQQQLDTQMVSTAIQIRGVLTADQLSKVSAAHDKLKQIHSQIDAILGPPDAPPVP